MITTACSTDEQVVFTARPTTAQGRPARFDGPIRATINVDNTNGATTEQDPNNDNVVRIVPGDTPGFIEGFVEADVDLGEGSELINESFVIEVSGAKAANFGIASTVEPKGTGGQTEPPVTPDPNA